MMMVEHCGAGMTRWAVVGNVAAGLALRCCLRSSSASTLTGWVTLPLLSQVSET